MKVLVFSDTHRRYENFINQTKKLKDIDLFIHLGDMVEDAEIIKSELNKPFIIIRGNNEFNRDDIPLNEVIELEDVRIFLTHGHKEGVEYGLKNLVDKAKENNCTMAMYGHTHVYKDETINGVRILNPGSVGYDRAGEYESYVVMDINGNDVEIERLRL